ncbi:uncharacterized protein FIBRA_03292 [Fibroporia radiculosa]|uniref:Asl1-like glycosyl hydrolase catalytic domain-containing protein n=1 Tax=Fibroporia radiculosa TaxID=599839 RepID=J4G4W7_9APHY|nr:uncharacterized protein FIBRA_03292 [Fibroporia radiculosa]CCM01243.1 predicted protein [Fibroporia radiculosa]
MKFSVSLVSFSLVVAGLVEAAHISNLQHLKAAQKVGLRRRGGPSATYPGTVTATATTSSAAPSSTPTNGSSSPLPGGIKRGLSFNDASLTEQFTSSQVSWAYNWGQTYSGSIPEGAMFIPMLWGDSSSFTSTWSANAQAAINNGSKVLFSFNEPDDSSQANMTPQEAASAWMQYMEPFAGKATLVSPAVTNGGAPMGETWLDQFVSACSGCTIDAFAMHIYDSATNEAYYQSYISGFVQKYGKPVWVTEFGATGNSSQVQTFLSSMVSYLDNLDGLAAYAWFMDEVGNLVNSDGSLTSLAEAYVA